MKNNRFMNVLLKAKEENIAVGAVNIFNYLTAEAAVKAAEEIGVNLIIQTSAGTVEHFGAQKLYDIVDAARKGAKIEVALHLDHCRNKELGKLCADTGWDSIMMDFSHLPFEENIANTREMAEYAHSRNVAIEGEIGVISGVEEEIVSDEAVGADFEETMEFVERSQIDAVAPAIGTAHGIYHGVPKINFELVEKLGKEKTPVVIHGGSGLSAETFTRLIELGGRKVNISTLVKNAYLDKTKELILSGEKFAPIPFDTEVENAVKEEVKKSMLANYECDLHGHTNRSDGNDSPVEYIRHAVHRGVKILAITDHDIVPPEMIELGGGKRQEITAYAKGIGVELLRGIEISCETYIDDVHLVCLGCDWNAPYFKELDEFTINSKVNSYRKLIDLLNEQGMEMTWEEVLQNNGYPVQEQFVQKKMIFELMARKGYMESWKEAKLYVKNSKEVSVKREKPDAVSVIKEIHKLGGIIILAHPYLISEPVSYKGKEMSRQEFIEVLIEAGLDGIEASYTYDKTSYGGTMTKDEIKKEVIERYAGRGLIISGGSDYHADGKKGVKNPREIGECGITREDFMKYEKLVRILP